MDQAAWFHMKQKEVKCKSQKSEEKLFAYGQTKPIKVLATFDCDIFCNDLTVSCVDQFTVVESSGKDLRAKKQPRN